MDNTGSGHATGLDVGERGPAVMITAGPERRQTPSRHRPTEDEVWALVERITHSPALSGSQALQAFLRYITRHAIAGTPENIKEQRIGCEVLGRRPDYDPALDNIVRVRAHELRNKLAKYFETSGIADDLVITIPRGSYVPLFHFRSPDTPITRDEAVKAIPQVRESAAQPKAAGWPAGLATKWAGWLAAVLLGTLLLINVLGSSARETRLNAGIAGEPPRVHDFWSQLFPSNGRQLLVVAADSTFALWQDVTGTTLNLGQYLGRRSLLLDSPDKKTQELAARRLTSAADLDIAIRLAERGTSLGGRAKAQFARNLNVEELQTDSAVLIGSRRSNPWVELFEPRMNFVLTQDTGSGAPAFQNRHPKQGEPTRFAIPHILDSDGTEQKEMNAYAHIALVPNLSGTGYVLILEGLNMEGTEAAGEFVLNSAALDGLLRSLDYRAGRRIQSFEALLNLTSVPGGFANTRVVGYRTIRD